jgi:hypothetical protein
MFAVYVGISTREALVAQVHTMLRTHEAGFFFRMTGAFSHSYAFPLARCFAFKSSSEFLSVLFCRVCSSGTVGTGRQALSSAGVSFGSDEWRLMK